MSQDSVIDFKSTVEGAIKDGLSDLIRSAAKQAIQSAVLEEINEFVDQFKSLKLEDGKLQVVKNGYHPERSITTGVGSVSVTVPRSRDRKDDSNLTFNSSLIPPYMRRAKSLDELLPLLYLKGLSTNSFQSALAPILGDKAKNISPNVICRLKEGWLAELEKWKAKPLTNKQYVYWWVDGVYLSARMESEKTCVLVIIGATEDGKKELVAFNDGFRESTDSWLELLREIKSRGLTISPNLAIGDGNLGFWSAMEKEHPNTEYQRCWVHKTANILAKLPKSLQPHAKSKLKDIYTAPTKNEADKAFDEFLDSYQVKYPRVVKCLEKDRSKMLSYYNYPAEHWGHIRTTNPIESTFATVKHRTRQARGCYSRDTILGAFFKLVMQAESNWAKLKGYKRLAEVVKLTKFIDGISEHEIDKLKQDNKDAA
jgi:putative transposase